MNKSYLPFYLYGNVEVAPAYDHGSITALAAASLGLDMLCLFARK